MHVYEEGYHATALGVCCELVLPQSFLNIYLALQTSNFLFYQLCTPKPGVWWFCQWLSNNSYRFFKHTCICCCDIRATSCQRLRVCGPWSAVWLGTKIPKNGTRRWRIWVCGWFFARYEVEHAASVNVRLNNFQSDILPTIEPSLFLFAS